MRKARNADFGSLQETFLVCAASTILIIRTELWLTNYPQIGGHGLHIAHLLWGGLLMLLAIGTLVTFLGRSPRRTAAIVGGVGFGFFIDELGKFVTSDNDYFFKPAAAMIYAIFVALFLVSRAMRRRRGLSAAERKSNVIELLGEAARGEFSEHDRTRALELLDGADPDDRLAAGLRELVGGLEAQPPRRPGPVARTLQTVRARFADAAGRRWFGPAVTWTFFGWAALSILTTGELVFDVIPGLRLEGQEFIGHESDALSELSPINIAHVVATLICAGLVGLGLARIVAGTPVNGYRVLELALLVSILVARLFAFVESQFAAAFGLSIDLLLLIAVRAVLERERRSMSGNAPTRGTGLKVSARPADNPA
ncbi:MAG TPA: hypothetical protein VFZ00_19775 [Solirubrobacter sp.]|nr:hypothetical protein [Solirubrobacter sp.]